MDTKRFFTSMLIAGALMLAFMYFTGRMGGGGGSGATVTTANPIYLAIPVESTAFENNAQPETILLGGAEKDDTSLLAVRVNNVTAGIDSVQFNVKDYAATYKRTEPMTLFSADPALAKPFSTLGIHITVGDAAREVSYGPIRLKRADGTYEVRPAAATDSAGDISNANSINMLASGYVWKVDAVAKDKDGVNTDAVLSATFQLEGAPIAKITKRFHIEPKSYDMIITHTVENLTDKALHVRIDQLAGPALRRDDLQTDDRFFHALDLNTAKQYVDEKGYNLTFGELRKAAAGDGGTIFVGGKQGQFFDYAKDPYLWVASSNRFFAAIVRPLPETGNSGGFLLATKRTIPEPGHVAGANIDLMKAGLKPADDEAIVRLTGRTIDVAPRGKMEEPLAVYLGPKKRDLLQGDVKAAAGTPPHDHAVFEYTKLVQFNTCMLYSQCYIEQIAYVVLAALDFLKGNIAFGNYGVAIMILVIVVRAVLHPLTRASQVNMAKMGKQMRDVAPQMEAMKKRYADNKKKQSEEMMRIYRENNINPAGGIMGCLPMFIQMPIWVALYSGLRADIDLRHAAFIPGWINDLASPDKLFPASIPVLGHPLFWLPLVGDIYGFNLLPILLAGVFFFQMKVSTATQPKPADEQQAQMQKMSQYMIFIFPLFLYNAPSGLNLYIFASTMGGLLDTYLVRKTLKKQGILAPSAPLLPTHEDGNPEV